MHRRHRPKFLPAAALGAALSVVTGAPWAQAVEGSASAGLEEVVVSARRVEENLQKVPITVTVLSADTLERRDVRSFQDMELSIPGFSICCGPGFVASQGVTIRGAVGVVSYFAEVPVDIEGGRALLFDISDVQALKGPQGTLFGVATNGGAILTQPTRPSSEIEGYGEVTIGTYGRRHARGALNTPFFDDKLRVRAAFVVAQTDPIGRRVDTGERLGDENYWAARLSTVFQPTENFENYTVVNYFSSDETLYFSRLVAYNPAGNAARVFGADTVAAVLAQQQALGPYKAVGLMSPSPWLQVDKLNIVNTTTYDLTEKLSVRNIFGYERVRSFGLRDSDGSPLPIQDEDTRNRRGAWTPTWSEELQLVGKRLWDRLDLQLGVFATESDFDSRITYTNSFGTLGATINKTENRTRAVYGQVNYDLSDVANGLSLTAGYRYTWDEVSQEIQRLTVATLQPSRIFSGNETFGSGSYTFGLQYQYNPEVMFYLMNSRGYSKGGLQLTAPRGFQSFRPETLNNLEVGVKSQFELGSMQARVNLAGFYGWYDDKQVAQVQLVQLNPPPAPLSFVSAITNAASARPRGFELDFTLIPIQSLELSGAVAYTRARYDEFNTIDAQGNPSDKAGLQFLRVHPWQYNIHGTYYLPVDQKFGSLSLTLDYAWYDREIVDSAAPHPDPRSYYGYWPERESFNASLKWRSMLGYEGFDVTAYATNLTRETGTGGGFSSISGLGTSSEAVAQPRMFGVQLRYSF